MSSGAFILSGGLLSTKFPKPDKLVLNIGGEDL